MIAVWYRNIAIIKFLSLSTSLVLCVSTDLPVTHDHIRIYMGIYTWGTMGIYSGYK